MANSASGRNLTTCPHCGWVNHVFATAIVPGHNALVQQCFRSRCRKPYVVVVRAKFHPTRSVQVIARRAMSGDAPPYLRMALAGIPDLTDDDITFMCSSYALQFDEWPVCQPAA